MKFLKSQIPDSRTKQKMKRRLAEFNSIAAVQRPRLARLEANHIIDDGSIDRTEILNHEGVAFAPSARMPPRDFCLRIEPGEIHFRKNIRQRIRAAQKVALLLQVEGRIKFSGSGYYQFRGRPCQARTCAAGQRLFRPAVRAKNIVGGDPAAAESAENNLHRPGCAAELVSRSAEPTLARAQFFQMRRQSLAHLDAGLKTMLRLVFDGASQNPFHLARKLRIDLARPRILRKVENKQRVVLRI